MRLNGIVLRIPGTLAVTSVDANGTAVTPLSLTEDPTNPNLASMVLPADAPPGFLTVVTSCSDETGTIQAEPGTALWAALAVTKTVEDGLEKSLGFQVSTMLRSADEIQAMIALDPFKGIEVTKATRLYVTLLADKITSTMKLPYASDDGNFRILSRTDREIYSVLTVEEGSRTVDLMAVLEKEYGKRATTRNWNTIVKAAAL